MAQVLYADGIKTVRGALDSIKDSQAQRARWISRLRWQGEKSIAPDGSIWHEFYRMHVHDGAWSEGATRNREMIKASSLPAAHTTCGLHWRWVCDRRGNGKNGSMERKRSVQTYVRWCANLTGNEPCIVRLLHIIIFKNRLTK